MGVDWADEIGGASSMARYVGDTAAACAWRGTSLLAARLTYKRETTTRSASNALGSLLGSLNIGNYVSRVPLCPHSFIVQFWLISCKSFSVAGHVRHANRNQTRWYLNTILPLTTVTINSLGAGLG